MEDLFRLNPEVQRFERDFTFDDFDTNMHDEWKDASADRLKEPGWGNRYEYEAQLVSSVVSQNSNIKKVLEMLKINGEKSLVVVNNKNKFACLNS